MSKKRFSLLLASLSLSFMALSSSHAGETAKKSSVRLIGQESAASSTYACHISCSNGTRVTRFSRDIAGCYSACASVCGSSCS